MKKGTQIAYIPSHANGDLTHSDVEFGFITSQSERMSSHFVRYWERGEEGFVLHTTAGSELTPDRLLMKHKIVMQERVDKLLALIKAGD